MIQTAETKASLRKQCRSIREKLQLLSISLEVDDKIGILLASFKCLIADVRFVADPELLMMTLRNGVGLLNIFSAATKDGPNKITHNHENDSTATELPAYLCLENIQRFLNFAREFGAQESDLFQSEELYTYSLDGCERVLRTLNIVFGLEAIASKIQKLQELAKAKNQRSGQAPMTQDDFRRKVLEELVMTEQGYVRDLDKVVAQYIRPLEDRIASTPANQMPLAEEEVLAIFCNMDVLAEFHRSLVNDLQVCTADKMDAVAAAFVSRVRFLKDVC
jgi:hypothetical protein